MASTYIVYVEAVTPYPRLRELRAQGGVHPGWPEMGRDGNADGETPMFAAYSYEAVRRVFSDSTLFSSRIYEDITGPLMGPTILEMDEPEHRLYRQLQQQAFARSTMDRWEVELVQPLVERTFARFRDAGRGDLVDVLFNPIPIRVIAALLGLPEEEIPRFGHLGWDLIGFREDMDRALAASAELHTYFSGILAARREEPRDDMVTVLAEVEVDGARLSDEEIIGFLRNLLPAGAETTSRSSANLAFALLTHTDQLEEVRKDRSLLPFAIEEGIRWETPLLNFVRQAVVDVEVDGTVIPAGSVVMVNLGSANHDEVRWSNPHLFDIHRERKPHIGFGHGAHQCLGMHLARLETTVMLDLVLDQLPGLRLDPDAAPPSIEGDIFRSPPRLDVVWDPP
jgi:cytochrome P450